MEHKIDYPTFRRLLAALETCNTFIRIRCAGESWQEFSQLLLLSENAMILQTGDNRNIIMNLRNVAEFEINSDCNDFGANKVYTLVMDL